MLRTCILAAPLHLGMPGENTGGAGLDSDLLMFGRESGTQVATSSETMRRESHWLMGCPEADLPAGHGLLTSLEEVVFRSSKAQILTLPDIGKCIGVFTPLLSPRPAHTDWHKRDVS